MHKTFALQYGMPVVKMSRVCCSGMLPSRCLLSQQLLDLGLHLQSRTQVKKPGTSQQQHHAPAGQALEVAKAYQPLPLLCWIASAQ